MGRRTHARDFLQKINYLQSNERVYIPSKLSKTLHRVGYGVFLPLFRFKMVSPLRFFPRASHTPVTHTRFQTHTFLQKKHREISNNDNNKHNTQYTHNTDNTQYTHNTQHTTHNTTKNKHTMDTEHTTTVASFASIITCLNAFISELKQKASGSCEYPIDLSGDDNEEQKKLGATQTATQCPKKTHERKNAQVTKASASLGDKSSSVLKKGAKRKHTPRKTKQKSSSTRTKRAKTATVRLFDHSTPHKGTKKGAKRKHTPRTTKQKSSNIRTKRAKRKPTALDGPLPPQPQGTSSHKICETTNGKSKVTMINDNADGKENVCNAPSVQDKTKTMPRIPTPCKDTEGATRTEQKNQPPTCFQCDKVKIGCKPVYDKEAGVMRMKCYNCRENFQEY